MEYASDGDVLKHIEEHKKKGTYFTEAEVWRILIQIVKGLKTLHDNKIVHRDIKSANIFLSTKLEVKLGDFNVSKIAKKGVLSTQTGTPYYASPEVWKDRPYDNKSDIWSLGVVIYEICALHPPFMANSMDQLYKKILAGVFPSIPSRYSNDLASLIKLCLMLKPENRPTCDKILQMEPLNKKLTDTLRKREGSCHLISTIKWDRNVKVLQQRLPKPCYNNKKEQEKVVDISAASRAKGVLPIINERSKSVEPKALPVPKILEEIKEVVKCKPMYAQYKRNEPVNVKISYEMKNYAKEKSRVNISVINKENDYNPQRYNPNYYHLYNKNRVGNKQREHLVPLY